MLFVAVGGMAGFLFWRLSAWQGIFVGVGVSGALLLEYGPWFLQRVGVRYSWASSVCVAMVCAASVGLVF